MSVWIRESIKDIRSGLISESDLVLFFNYDGKRGDSVFVLPFSLKLKQTLDIYKGRGFLIDQALSTILRDLKEFVSFSGFYNGRTQYVIFTKERQFGFSGYPRFFIPKEMVDSEFYSDWYVYFKNRVISIMYENGIPNFKEETYQYNYLFKETMDIDNIDVDFMCDFPVSCFTKPFDIVGCNAINENKIFLVVPNTASFNEERNKNSRTQKWVLQSASHKWKAIKLSSGDYVKSIDKNGQTIEVTTAPCFFIMNCIFETEAGQKMIQKLLLDPIGAILKSRDMSYTLVDFSSQNILSVFNW